MGFANEILDAIEIMVKQVVEDNTTKIYTGVCKSISTSTCVLTINGKDNTVKYYGGTPTVGTVYQVFIPFGNMSVAFIIVPGSGGGTVTGVTSVNGKTGTVVLNANDVGALPDTTAIPTKTSELDNDSGFITSTALDGYARETDIPTKVSQLDNDSGFVDATGAKNVAPVQSVDGSTGAVVTNAVKTTTQTLTDVQKTQARNNIGAGTSSFSGSYNDLSDKPTIPTKTSDLNNDSGFIDSSAIPVKSVNTKTGEVVLTASDVGALPDSTVIPVVNDAILDVQRNGTSVGTFTANASVNKTINIIVPTKASDVGALPDTTSIPSKTSDLTNDSGYITSSDIPVKSVNGKTGVVTLGASDVGAVSTSDVTTTLGTSTTKVPSEKAVSDAIGASGGGDMLKATYDPDGSVATSGGIPAYVEANGGKIDTIKVNETAQPIINKEVNIAVPTNNNQLINGAGYITASDVPVKSVNSKTGNVVLTATDVGALSDTTIIPVVNDATLNVQRNGVPVGTFTANASTDKTINIVVPTKASDVGALPDTTSIPSKTSELDNDSGFITSAQAPVTSVNTKTGAVTLVKSDIGLSNVDNVKQYSASNPPPYPVTSVNGQTGDVTVGTELPEHLVKYDTLAPIETTTLINADTLQGHAASYFATSAEVSALSAVVDSNADDITANAQNISTNTQNISTLQSNISTLQSSVNGKVSKSGDTMTGALIAQNNTNYSVAQVRNIIISTSDPSGGNSGDIWIKYTP